MPPGGDPNPISIFYVAAYGFFFFVDPDPHRKYMHARQSCPSEKPLRLGFRAPRLARYFPFKITFRY
jgi:hypothetical protein